MTVRIYGIQYDLASKQMTEDHGKSWTNGRYAELRKIMKSWGAVKEGGSLYVIEAEDADSRAAWVMVTLSQLEWLRPYLSRFSIFDMSREYGFEDLLTLPS